MAESSSSSLEFSESSSSIDSNSSSSLSSSSLSSRSQSSLSSWSTSSSSSVDSSSSSSSSLYELHGKKMLPFLWTGEQSKKVRGFAFNNEYCFAGLDGSGEVIRSVNRYHWETFFRAEDFSCSAIYAYSGYLFVGTSPNGKISKIDLETGDAYLIDTLNINSVAFFEIGTDLYLCAGRNVYAYDLSDGKFYLIYEAYAGITSVYSNKSTAVFSVNGENIISFDGNNWTLVSTNKETISSVRNLSTNLFSKIDFATINRGNISGIKEADLLEIMPYNKECGIASVIEWNNIVIAGGKNYGRVFAINNGITKVIFESDEEGVNAVYPIDSTSIFVSMGDSLYMGWFGNMERSAIPKSKWYFVKVMALNNERVTTISHDSHCAQFLIGTSNGRILATDKIKLNAFATGTRQIYSQATNQYGASSNVAYSSVNYALYDRIVEIAETKAINKWKYARKATISSNEKITGVFVSPIINVKNDFGMWKTLIWEETRAAQDKIKVFIKTANSINELYQKDWQSSFQAFEGETGTITRQLNNIKLSGNYLQIKVEMEVEDNATEMAKITVEYSAKNASYFFTTNFSIDSTEMATRGLLTANISTPVNTEVTFGVTDTQSADWNDYTVISPDSFFTLNNMSNLKIGIKFVSYDESIPVVSEFSIMRNKEPK